MEIQLQQQCNRLLRIGRINLSTSSVVGKGNHNNHRLGSQRQIVTMSSSRRCRFGYTSRGIFGSSRSNTKDSKKVQAARSYLDAWVGNNGGNASMTKKDDNKQDSNHPSTTISTSSSSSSSSSSIRHRTLSPMLVSSSSYLLSTLRIEKNDTPESISYRLEMEYSDDGNMIAPNKSAVDDDDVCCPIVLDLRAWRPDGSHHYRPPPEGSLKQLVDILNRYGLNVIGLHGTPTELQETDAKQLAIPNLFLSGSSKSNFSSSSAAGSSSNYIQIQDIIQMVRRQNERNEGTDADLKYHEDKIATEAIRHDDRFVNNTIDSTQKDEIVKGRLQSVVSGISPTAELNAEPQQQQEDEEQQPHTEEKQQQQQSILPPPSQPLIPPEATMYYGSVRSGQQVSSAKGQSLIVLGSVNSGGEVLSDGDIIVMGRLRGRAIAGLESSNAKIIAATSMDPELVCVSSVLTNIENIFEEYGIQPENQPAMISLNPRSKDELIFEPIEN